MPEDVLKALAVEFKGVVADALLLDIGARLGTRLERRGKKFVTVKKKHDWKRIYKLFRNCQALDPYFNQTFILAQGWLPWSAKMVNEMEDILLIAAEKRPWDWQPFRFIGFNSYFFNNNLGKAGKFYLKAALVPHSPPFLSVLGGRLALKGGVTETAIMLLENILQHSTHSDFERKQIENRYEALKGSLIIEKAMQIYRKENRKIPSSVEELVEKGFLKHLPKNPYGSKYCIKKNGKVYFDELNCSDQ
ncbi:hypothetical protein [Desulfomarina profundi]|uniref:hypothetical protein n=1 Tax=Desulfomarina profundi TaxID=2772557 RepID=UPI001E553D28|nr:hypothetical protein [Desulfomarina profundi]